MINKKIGSRLGNIELNEELLRIAYEYATEKSLLDLRGNILIMMMEFYGNHQQEVSKIADILAEAFNTLTMKSDHQKLLEIETLYAHIRGKFICRTF